MRRIFPVLAALALIAACSAPRRVKRVLEPPPERSPAEQARYDAGVKRGAVLLGMTKDEVRKSRGKPQKSDIVERFGGNVRRWMYPWDEVYFDARGLVVGVKATYR